MRRNTKKIKKTQKAIGERLRELRLAKGFSNYETFAFTFGISRSNYGKYENGHNMRMDTFIHILDALDITFTDFFSEIEK